MFLVRPLRFVLRVVTLRGLGEGERRGGLSDLRCALGASNGQRIDLVGEPLPLPLGPLARLLEREVRALPRPIQRVRPRIW